MNNDYKLLPPTNPNGKKRVKCKQCGEIKEHHAKGLCHKCYKKYHWKPKKIICKNCQRIRPHKAFNLCAGCHTRLHHYDKIKSYNARKAHNISLKQYESITKKCICCGFSKIVELHHLDGNKDNKKHKNLVGLCPNCHNLIHSYDYYEEIKEILKTKGYDISKIKPNFIK